MTFWGYKRNDGSVGVRNHVVVVPACLCAESAARKIAAGSGAIFIKNPNGCGQNTFDRTITLKIMSGLVANPNVYAAVIVGLGCEQLQKNCYMNQIRKATSKTVKYISIQAVGGLNRTVEKGLEYASALMAEAKLQKRESCAMSDLILGLECGGSDATSGLSANVVLGKVTDKIIDLGGSAILSETPEAIGAEHILKKRGATPKIGEKIFNAIIECEKYYRNAGEDIRASNPSPGNKAGGITTLEEKSLGCINKSGSRAFSTFLEYGDRMKGKGLSFLNSTAYDVASVTAKAAAGAQLIAFTTGAGTPVGNPIVPVIKITGNKATAARMEDIIDFDTSGSIYGERSVEELSEELLTLIKNVSEGMLVCAEENEACEIAINQWSSYC